MYLEESDVKEIEAFVGPGGRLLELVVRLCFNTRHRV